MTTSQKCTVMPFFLGSAAAALLAYVPVTDGQSHLLHHTKHLLHLIHLKLRPLGFFPLAQSRPFFFIYHHANMCRAYTDRGEILAVNPLYFN